MKSSINYEGLNDISSELGKIAFELGNIGSELIDAISDLTKNDYWKGIAARNYTYNFNCKICPILQEISSQIFGYSNELEAVVEKYKNIDNMMLEGLKF